MACPPLGEPRETDPAREGEAKHGWFAKGHCRIITRVQGDDQKLWGRISGKTYRNIAGLRKREIVGYNKNSSRNDSVPAGSSLWLNKRCQTGPINFA